MTWSSASLTAAANANLRQQQVEQTPQLLQLILQWCAGQQEAPLRDEPIQVPGQLALPVLHALRLIDDHILPLHLPNAHIPDETRCSIVQHAVQHDG